MFFYNFSSLFVCNKHKRKHNYLQDAQLGKKHKTLRTQISKQLRPRAFLTNGWLLFVTDFLLHYGLNDHETQNSH